MNFRKLWAPTNETFANPIFLLFRLGSTVAPQTKPCGMRTDLGFAGLGGEGLARERLGGEEERVPGQALERRADTDLVLVCGDRTGAGGMRVRGRGGRWQGREEGQ